MRRYIAFLHSIGSLVSEFEGLLRVGGRTPLDPDDKFDDVHLYIWYTLTRIFNPDFGDKDTQLALLGQLGPFYRTGLDQDMNKIETWDFWFRNQIFDVFNKISPALMLDPKEFIFHYITDGRKFAEIMLFAPTYIFKEIPENMEPLTQVGVSQMIDRYQDHVETTEWGKLVAERISLISDIELPKENLVPKKFWRQE